MNPDNQVSSFFVVLQERRKKEVRSIKLEKQVKGELTELFETQAREFLQPEVERIPFDPRFKPDDDHIFEIKDFKLPEHIEHAAKNTDGVFHLKLSETEVSGLKSVFATAYDHETGELRILFQKSNRSRVLEAKGTLFIDNGVFKSRPEPGLTLDTNLIAVYENGSLLFRMFHGINPILDIKDCFVEATNEEIREVLGHELFLIEDIEATSKLCDMTMRKRIAYIKKSEILNHLSARKIVNGIKEYFDDIDISWKSARASEKEKLKVPKNKKDVKRLLNFLCESYYVGELTMNRYETTSHKNIK